MIEAGANEIPEAKMIEAIFAAHEINQKIIAFTILKMLVLPIVVTLILKQFVDNTYLLAVSMAALATPSGNVIPLLANLYNKEGYPVSVQGVAVTTAAAVITMPVVALVTGLG